MRTFKGLQVRSGGPASAQAAEACHRARQRIRHTLGKEVIALNGMLNRWMKSFDRIGYWMACGAGILILIFSLLTCLEAILRHFFNSPTYWNADLCRYLLLISVSMGGFAALLNGSHIAVDFVVERLPEFPRRIVTAVSYLITCVVCMLVSWQAWVYFNRAVANDWRPFGTLTPPSSIFYMALLIGNLLLVLAAISKMIEAVRGKEDSDSGNEELEIKL